MFAYAWQILHWADDISTLKNGQKGNSSLFFCPMENGQK
jgi:hypothetical protein